MSAAVPAAAQKSGGILNLDIADTTQWYPKMARKDFTIGAVPIEAGVDDPDEMFIGNFGCGSLRNYAGYCDANIDRLIHAQSQQSDTAKRRALVAEIEKKLADAAIRTVLFYRSARAACSLTSKD